MDALELLQQLGLNIVWIFKIYVKFALITLVIYFVAEWYIVRYGVELEDQLDAQLAANERPASNSTLSKVFRFIVNFFII
ncbi:uncharacterized protein LOC111601692 [Drosophila hydei]|uniref:Uncharacterized protein LOC111601692 n=1 Tax=Drosophila hydei TaxID=7224 RepID=A0A6J1M2Q6_DROHY|nr:uncharacterized protein LOC111601692 [Drosophila hydei]XP_023174171.2 uncharacterized protein LOC111601692 [Drosophila hydei]XP_030079769.1 uncharacterized protein LOC111601692 [Drosophila hydei]